jgi:hypothetical protein
MIDVPETSIVPLDMNAFNRDVGKCVIEHILPVDKVQKTEKYNYCVHLFQLLTIQTTVNKYVRKMQIVHKAQYVYSKAVGRFVCNID